MILKEKCAGSSKKQSKKQKKMSTSIEEKVKQCPLCMEVLELDDLNFYPCKCGYQVCRFCWHRIRVNENCLCPACRRQYPEDPVTFKPLTQEELQKVKNEKKMKEMQKKKEIAESRKQLANVRVVQKNLVYVHGLPVGIDMDEDRYRKIEKIFKDFGAVLKCIINNKTNYAGSQSHRASAYVTYQRIDDALRAFKNLPNLRIEGMEIKTSLGTTKYCSNFLKNVHCPKQDCMYLHEMADEELCFTKEQIHAGEHLACGIMLYERMMEHIHHRNSQISQSKESSVVEQDVEVEKPSPEKIQLNEDSSESYQSESEESNNIYPVVKSKLQHLFANGEQESSVFCSDFKTPFGCNFDSPSSESARSIGSNSDPQLHLSLSNEGPIVNSVHSPVNNVHNSVKNYQNFPPTPPNNTQGLHNGDLWNEHRSASVIGPSNNHHMSQIQNAVLSEFSLATSGNTTSTILSRLPIHNNSNGINSSLSDSSFESSNDFDDDLGFDPCKYSLQGLEDLLISEARDTISRAEQTVHRNAFADPQRRAAVPTQQNMQQLLRLKQQQLQRQRNPPPGFGSGTCNSFQTSQPLHSPVFENRNPMPNRIAPVLSNSFNGVRQNYGLNRFPQAGISLNASSLTNGFSPQPVRSFQEAADHNFQFLRRQHQTLHDILPRNMMNSQQPVQSQRFENVSQLQSQQPIQQTQQQQFPTVDHNNLSPSFWNVNGVNQSQWMSAENCYQNQGMQDIRPSSPLLNMRRMPQMRPNELNRQVQQLARYSTNISPFSDNPHFMIPNSNNQSNQQAAKGVHTFP